MGKKSKPKRMTPARKINDIKRGAKSAGFAAIELASLFGPEAVQVYQNRANPVEAVSRALSLKTGFNFTDGTFKPERMIEGWGPYALQKVIRKAISFFGA